MSVEFRISVLIAVLFTGQSTICDAAAGDWIRPVISIGARSGTLPNKVPENQPLGQTNAYVEVEGATSYKIVTQPVDGLFALQNNGSLNITSKLDYENATSYALVIVASDGKGMTNTATVIVRIEDKNDNAPVFPGAPYLVVLPDNSMEGTFVVKVTAIDADGSVFLGNIKRYEIRPGGDNNSFFIEPTSGAICIIKDRQLSSSVKTNYTFTVVATDTGTPTRIGSADVTVCVTNCPPEHLPTLRENQNGESPARRNGGESVILPISSEFLLTVYLCMFALN